jgi:glyoxylase-like metal-dependent hydrolase (beta-lactamase superfamily II)
LEFLLLTHCHYDHSGGAAAVRRAFGCKIVAHARDAVFLEEGDSRVTAASWYGAATQPLKVDIRLQGEENDLALGSGRLTALHWPGHSPGSVVYTTRMEDQLVLFGQDVHGPIHPALLSDEADYKASLKKILALHADLLLEGHFGIIRGKSAVKAFIGSYLIE